MMSLKLISEHAGKLTKTIFPLIQKHKNYFSPWIEMHGWDINDPEILNILGRQAILNAYIRKTFPDVLLFETPFDTLCMQQDIPSEIVASLKSDNSFNIWGELYNALIPQSKRRNIGQFWTDKRISEWMTAWLLSYKPKNLWDVGCGSGNFLFTAMQIAKNNFKMQYYGIDVSPLMLNVALANFYNYKIFPPKFLLQDYLTFSLPKEVEAVVCNPPYTRHHHISPEIKDRLQHLFRLYFHRTISRQGTMAFHFLLKIIAELPEGAHAAVIVPMEVLDARYGKFARQILCQNTILKAVIHFSSEMNAFAKVDVGATILLFQKGNGLDNIVKHLTLTSFPNTKELLQVLRSDVQSIDFGSIAVQTQNELIKVPKWFSISLNEKMPNYNGLVVPLKELATVMRGIATGANEFFALSNDDVKKYYLEKFVVKTIQRNREIQDIVLDETRWQNLLLDGKRVWLLYLNGQTITKNLKDYIAIGETKGINTRSLVKTRKQWYMMEQRNIPPIFFTILTRGNPRFILNKAGVRPLNMFSLLYPRKQIIANDCVDILWALLNSDFTLSKLQSVSRTYGGKTLKVEPRELDNVPVLNPLVMSNEIRQQIKSFIAEFFTHQNIELFLQEINHIVTKLLTDSSLYLYQSNFDLVEQLQLCERTALYESK
ncbi:MAG: N-6 DNA methylase [Nitrospirota bacterium]